MLQIAYWWNPLVWLAGARIRNLREQAVDDAVVLALKQDADSYALTLLDIAKRALNRPLASLGLIGILESHSALAKRIERLIRLTPPKRSGLTAFSILGIVIFGAIAIPAGQPPAAPAPILVSATANPEQLRPIVSAQNAINDQQPHIRLDAKFVELSSFDPASEPPESPLHVLPRDIGTVSTNPLTVDSKAVAALLAKFEQPENMRLTYSSTSSNTCIVDTNSQKGLMRRVNDVYGDVTSLPPVHVVNGNQAHLAAENQATIVTGVKISIAPDPYSTNMQTSCCYLTEPLTFGHTLDIVPKLQKDGRTIALDVQSHVVNNLGYDKQTKEEQIHFSAPGGEPLTAEHPFPRFQVREMFGQAVVPNGQTLLLGGPVSYTTVKIVDEVPYLRSIPLLGNLFWQRESVSKQKRHLFVLVTATLVDFQGNPVQP